jgi:putative transposase
MILEAITTGLSQGARLETVCERVGVSARTVQRWRNPELAEDRRAGPRTTPKNRLSDAERKKVLELATSEEFRNLSPKQMVPMLADRGVYVASEATVYRLLRQNELLSHRGRARPRTSRPRPMLVASAPNQVWTWDITYLRGPIRGSFLYLYLLVDVYSRRIMGWEVADEESADRAANLFKRAWAAAGRPEGLTLHSDNGGPMKGSTMLATLQKLGVVASFSRPRVSDDNPFSEALFRTLKYCPSYPNRPFAGVDEAGTWVQRFVRWYNTEHLHSGINFVTPDDRHSGRDLRVLEHRKAIYGRARRRRPERWTGEIRDWSPSGAVFLNPSPNAIPAAPTMKQAA